MYEPGDLSAREALNSVLDALVRKHGATDFEWLCRRARKELRDGRVDPKAIEQEISRSTVLLWRPDGTVDHLLHVLDGCILTQRARAPLADRCDLWCTVALQPLLNVAANTPLSLANGTGEVRKAPNGQEVLVGPPGWLPDVPRYGVVGLRVDDGLLSAVPVDEAEFPDLPRQEQVRQLLAHHYRIERWYSGDDDVQTRPAEMVQALGLGLLEDPDLLSVPLPPLDELLYLSLEQDCDLHYWRDRAGCVPNTVSFPVHNMPEALHMELGHRAKRYGMSFDQYVVAVLGHLAWRTPFAEDMEPWEDWDPEGRGKKVVPLSVVE